MTDSLRHTLPTQRESLVATGSVHHQTNKYSHSMPFHEPILGVHLCCRATVYVCVCVYTSEDRLFTSLSLSLSFCFLLCSAFLSGREYAWVDSRFRSPSLGLHPLQSKSGGRKSEQELKREKRCCIPSGKFTYYRPTCTPQYTLEMICEETKESVGYKVFSLQLEENKKETLAADRTFLSLFFFFFLPLLGRSLLAWSFFFSFFLFFFSSHDASKWTTTVTLLEKFVVVFVFFFFSFSLSNALSVINWMNSFPLQLNQHKKREKKKKKKM